MPLNPLTGTRVQGVKRPGQRYDFVLATAREQEQHSFELYAVHRATGRWSVVNTVNAIMAELLSEEEDVSDLRWSGTPWYVTRDECQQLERAVDELLNDEVSVAHIEDALDEDRAEGEWNIA